MWRLEIFPARTFGAGATGSMISGVGFSDKADPWVEPRVEQINDEVGDNKYKHKHADDCHHGGALALEDGLVQQVADAGDIEDAFGDDRAAHQGSQVGTQEGD